MIAVGCWVAYIGDFGDGLLKKTKNDRMEMSRTIIGAISRIMAWAIEWEDPLGLRGIVGRMENCA